ncbi:MAG: ABC transporter permease [Chitinophagaceae bacterium]|nr:ABC transporter permease [Chitinophagaceae bacterium]
MWHKLLVRLLYGVLVLVGVVVVVFVIFQAFGDPARMVLGQSGDAKTIQNIRRELNLDKPKWKQFVLYVNDISPVSVYAKETIREKKLKGFFIGGNTKVGIKVPYFGRSYQTNKAVINILMEALPGTIMLAVAAMLIAIAIGIPLGIFAAIKQNTWMDTTAVFSSVIGISAPSFYMAIVIAYVFGLVLHSYTGLPLTGSWFDINETTGRKYLTLQNVILPAVTLGIRPLAIIVQLTRSSMLDVMGQDYIRTAYAKGLSNRYVIWRHALPNALNPVITAVTGWFAELLAGAFFVEFIFGYKGVGLVTVEALENLDYPVVMAAVLMAATIFVIINIVSDVLNSIIDPRVKME